MNTISEFVKVSFYDNSSKEHVDIIELQEIKEELKTIIKEKGLKDKWVKEFFEL